jgi:L-histidine Nalpha-methyltransferase
MSDTRTLDPSTSEDASRTDPDMLADVVAGLGRSQKELSPKYFYDERGSELFEEITRQDEYYPTRTERALLERWMPSWVAEDRPAELVELGAGSAEKSRVILDEMVLNVTRPTFVPVDVSGDFLQRTAARLREEYPELDVVPAVADISKPLDIEIAVREPTWFALLGSTIGNFEAEAATSLLKGVSRRLRAGDRFLMGADLRPNRHKSRECLEAAYNDARGVTAEFNLNILQVLNRELGADFDPSTFAHHAFYDETSGRMEMHLRSTVRQTVHVPGAQPVDFSEGETIRTEISCKYDRASIDQLFSGAGLEVERWVEDENGLFALMLARPVL